MTDLAAWNAGHPVGSPVRYWPGGRIGPGRESVTRSRAWALGDGTPVVAVEGYAGGIALTHVEQLPAPHPTDETPPTQWAYDAAVRALEKHRQRADTAEAKVRAVERIHVWTNEDGRQFLFADDVRAALDLPS